MAQLSPYLNYNGNCREAMNFYKDCLGGNVDIMKVSDVPEMAAQMPAHLNDAVLHAAFVADGISIMASDLNRSKPNEGNTFALCLVCKDEVELKDLFEKLSAGGTIVESPQVMPWGDFFGALKDKFGKEWVLDCQVKK
ncbi:MAG: VOC family protein [Parafilimonas sp.]